MAELEVVAALDDIAKRALDAYWKAKDLPAAVALSQEGIERGQAAAAERPAEADAILGKVKAMAFNLASFTWPGWDEAGITITSQQMQLGQAAAELNYRLAVELKRPADKVADAHWIVGAHALSAGEYDRALEQFDQCKHLTSNDTARRVADGYAAIAHLAARHDAAAAFDRAVDALKEINSEDSRFYVEQLITARRVFTGR
jgi:tetratricopeptide (TPR) repeat protein